jgi:hypothetical protein
MRWFSDPRMRWAEVFCTLVALLTLLPSCATAPSSRKYVGPLFDLRTPSQAEQSFPDLWENQTVYLGAAKPGGKPLQLINPFAMAGGGPGGGGGFPLQITATLMDSLLIEAGLQHYAALIAMTSDEEAAFRSTYFQRYHVENHLLIWCELQTTWAELHLDLDRWTIFIEDDAINRYEPVQILEESQSAYRMAERGLPGLKPGKGRRGWEVRQKSLMLCFPKRDFYGSPILSEEVKFLKLVFQLSEDEMTRVEGTWVFKE